MRSAFEAFGLECTAEPLPRVYFVDFADIAFDKFPKCLEREVQGAFGPILDPVDGLFKHPDNSTRLVPRFQRKGET